MPAGLHAILLAAGEGRRLGFPKAALTLRGQWVLPRLVGALRRSGAERVVLVLSQTAQEAIAELGSPGADEIVLNPEPEAGRTGSVLCGLEAVPRAIQGLFIHPCDVPLLSGKAGAALAARWRAQDDPASLVARLVTPAGRGGHPLLVGSARLDTLRAYPPDRPLRDLLHEDPRGLLNVTLAGDPGPFWDVDTPDNANSWSPCLSVLPTVLPIRTILVASDLSPASEPAVHAAAILAKEYGAALHLVHALPAHLDPRLVSPDFPEQLFQETEKELRELAGRVPDGAATFANISVQRGHAVDVILEAASRVGADLLVVGTHGKTGIEHISLGSVAENVAKNAPLDVLLVRQAMKRPFAEPALALNVTNSAFRAAARALEVSQVCKAPALDVISVYDLPVGWHAGSQGEEMVSQRVRAVLEEDLTPLLEEMRAAGHVKIRFNLEMGSAASVILHAVEAEGNDLLLAGSHNRPRWVSALLGDTARVFAHKAPCATWLVRDLEEAHPLRDAILKDLGLA